MLQLRLSARAWARLSVSPRNAHTAFRTSLARFYSTTPPPPPDLSEGELDIYNKLANKFSPTALRVQDVSGGCGTFYAILIASNEFKGLSMVKQHKLVNHALKCEIEGIHGLQLKTIAPE